MKVTESDKAQKVTESTKVIKELFKRVVYMSVRLVAIITGLGFAYGFIVSETFTFNYAFRANFWVGTTILIGGLLLFITPAALLLNKKVKKSHLVDHTTYREKFVEEQERKRVQAYELIFIGICNIAITGTLQLVVWLMS